MDDRALAATMSLPYALPRAGDSFAGRYRVVEALGSGGMGAVYRVHDTELDEEVALKVLRAGLAEDAAALARFRREVKLARRVTHVNVARTYDLGVHEGTLFLTMELIAGVPLSARMAEGPLSLAQALRAGCEIARGLTAAHTADVVHRDLKPDNVMVSEERVVITDFGIARPAEIEDGEHTSSGLIGTPAYMAPEQVEGQPLDGRTDVYALGVLLFEALVGRLPFEAPTPLGMAAMRLTTDPPDPRSLMPRLPGAIAQLVLDMLARRREARPAAQSVLARLEVMRGAASPLAPGLPELSTSRRAATVRIGAVEASDGPERALAVELARALAECVQSVDHVELVRSQAELTLSASVRARRDRVRVRARLEDREGEDVWIASIDGTLEEELELEDAVMAAVRGALATQGSARARARTAPARTTAPRLDPEVSALFDEARANLRSFLDLEQVEVSIGRLEEAARRAPDDPAIQGALGFALARKWVLADGRAEKEDLARAEELCYRAIASDPTHPEALQALGMLRYVTGEMRGAARAMREALARSPELVEASIYLARLLDESGHPELAAERWTLVERLQPQRIEPALFRMREAAFTGDLPGIDRAAEECRRRPGGAPYALLARSRFVLWWGDRARARECLDEALASDSPIARVSIPRLMGAVLGEAELERGWVEKHLVRHDVMEGSRRMAAFGRQMATEVLLAQGDAEGALHHLSGAAALPLIDLAWMDRCPLFARVRDEPRFAAARAIVAARVDDMWS